MSHRYNAFISYSHATDSKLAQALQHALHKFAKPWYKKRNLELFRDESNLSASPHLWNNIVKALDESEYFILLGSPLSAHSDWVNKEISYWLESHTSDTILIVLTGGVIEWDAENKRFRTENNALPTALFEEFKETPFYVDLRQSKSEQDLTLDNPIFKKEVLKVAAKLHGMSPIDLASEEVTVHRKMMRIRNYAIGTLAFLFVGALVACGFLLEAEIKARNTSKLVVEKNRENLAKFARIRNHIATMDSLNWHEKQDSIKNELDSLIVFRTRKEMDSIKKLRKP